MKRVVITGIGALTPIGNTVEEYGQGLMEGSSGAEIIHSFDTGGLKTKFACQLKNYHPDHLLDKSILRKHDPYVHYALIASNEAIANAGLNSCDCNSERVGVIWSSGNGGFQSFQEDVLEYARHSSTIRFSPYFIPKTISNMASGMISIYNGFKGLSYTTVSACASSNSAIINAADTIRMGKADIVICGGSDAAVATASMSSFNSMKALSVRNESPEEASRPFDIDRDGFVIGEGAGALVLEDYDHAINRNVKILAEYAGGAMTSDAYHISLSHPDGEGARRAMQLALDDAHLEREDIDYINAHATSTPAGDVSEAKAIQNLFTRNNKYVVTALKSMTGHLLGAAGAIEAVASVLSLQYNKIPATLNLKQMDPEIGDDFPVVKGNPLDMEINNILSNTFGFGGHNATIVLKRY